MSLVFNFIRVSLFESSSMDVFRAYTISSQYSIVDYHIIKVYYCWIIGIGIEGHNESTEKSL